MKKHVHSALLMTILLVVLACGSAGSTTTDQAEPISEEPASDTPSNALVVRMLYGSEKENWLTDVTAEFNAQQNPSTSGKPIFVEAIPIGSAESMNLILDGADQPAVWSPASGILLPVANQEWGRMNGGEQLVDINAPQLVLSPVIIALWKPMAEALGWPDESIGWNDIAEMTRSRQTWAELGGEEFWGSFQFGHTHPDYSNSGVTSILAIVYAATGKTRGMTVADVQQANVGQFLNDVESAIIHYGRSTGFFGKQMFNRGPGYLSAAVLYENLVIEGNDPNRDPRAPLPLVAIYPQEGTFWSDHPYAILNAPWVDDELRAAAETYRDFLLARPQQERALQYGFRPADPDIPITEPFTPENGVDPSQPKTVLAVPEADVIQAVRELWSQHKKRVEVQVVLDVSGSMAEEERLVRAKEALEIFISELSDEDRLGVVLFNHEANELTPLSPLGPKRTDVMGSIRSLFPDGGTRLIDTVGEVYSDLQQQQPGAFIRSIIILSDGDDRDSIGTVDELLNLLGADESGQSIKVFAIAYGTGSDVDVELMEVIADESGGQSYIGIEPARIEQVYRDIATFF